MLISVAPSTSNINGGLRCQRHLGLEIQSMIEPARPKGLRPGPWVAAQIQASIYKEEDGAAGQSGLNRLARASRRLASLAG
jgi:hypothetical protein